MVLDTKTYWLIDRESQCDFNVHKDYYRKGSVGSKNLGRGSQGAWRQDKLFGGKPPVLK
jgi:hypothetical protein